MNMYVVLKNKNGETTPEVVCATMCEAEKYVEQKVNENRKLCEGSKIKFAEYDTLYGRHLEAVCGRELLWSCEYTIERTELVSNDEIKYEVKYYNLNGDYVSSELFVTLDEAISASRHIAEIIGKYNPACPKIYEHTSDGLKLVVRC